MEKRICSHCGKELDAYDLICGKCGTIPISKNAKKNGIKTLKDLEDELAGTTTVTPIRIPIGELKPEEPPEDELPENETPEDELPEDIPEQSICFDLSPGKHPEPQTPEPPESSITFTTDLSYTKPVKSISSSTQTDKTPKKSYLKFLLILAVVAAAGAIGIFAGPGLYRTWIASQSNRSNISDSSKEQISSKQDAPVIATPDPKAMADSHGPDYTQIKTVIETYCAAFNQKTANDMLLCFSPYNWYIDPGFFTMEDESISPLLFYPVSYKYGKAPLKGLEGTADLSDRNLKQIELKDVTYIPDAELKKRFSQDIYTWKAPEDKSPESNHFKIAVQSMAVVQIQFHAGTAKGADTAYELTLDLLKTNGQWGLYYNAARYQNPQYNN